MTIAEHLPVTGYDKKTPRQPVSGLSGAAAPKPEKGERFPDPVRRS